MRNDGMTQMMITREVTVELPDSVAKAPVYEMGWTMLRVEKAIVVPKGTKAGNPTVDLQLIDADGHRFIAMTTGKIIKALAAVIIGVESRDE